MIIQICKYCFRGGPDEVIPGKKKESRLAFIFESQSIMSSSPAATFHQPACQVHSVQCAAKDSLSCVSMCVKGLVFVSVLLICSTRCIGKHYYGLAEK